VLGYERKFNAALREALGNTGEEAFVAHILAGQPEPPPYFARMKRDNKHGPALLPDGNLPAPSHVAAGNLPAALAKPNIAILDLRADRQAFARCHLRGALHAPLASGRLTNTAGSYVPEDAPILLVLDDPAQLNAALRELVRIGLDRSEHWIAAAEALANPALTTSLARIAAQDLPAHAAVLDVRSAGEFSTGHVHGATNIAHTRLAPRLAEVPAAEPLFVHCGSGLRAAVAASFLAATGHNVVWVDGNFADIPAALKSLA
jgi:hydroxyacylglutathione hydrolase